MTFTLDTSGYVEPDDRMDTILHSQTGYGWPDLSPFTQGYIEALMRSLYEAHHSEGIAARMRVTYLFSDLARETLARIIDIGARYAKGFDLRKTEDGQRQQGRQLWAFQQAENMPGFPPLTVQLCDDGKVRVTQ